MIKVEESSFPILAIRNMVLFPHVVTPLYIARKKSVKALELALDGDGSLFCVTQIDANIDNPKEEDLYKVGTIVKIPQFIKLPDGSYKILVQGNNRGTLKNFKSVKNLNKADIQIHKENLDNEESFSNLSKVLFNRFERYAKFSESVEKEVVASLKNISEPGRLSDLITANLPVEIDKKQEILETLDISQRVERLIVLLQQEVEWMKIDQRIHTRVKHKISKEQEKYYKHQKLRAIQEELGDDEEDPSLQEINGLQKNLDQLKLTKEAKEKSESELQKLKMMPAMSAEATVIRMYLEWIIKLPWQKRSRLNKDLAKAQEVLDKDHFGLEKVKDRIMESLAVQKRVKKLRGPIICLVGPPGVGKTSLGKSVAKAIGREFVRISLGGVRDESEIRGHRKTYIGAMPGRILKAMEKAGNVNPLIMLDEIDKMGMDYRGDPASALLEVLDPEQNKNFSDHYLELEYDLSDVLFITTSNSMNIPHALLDRMEIISIPGYTDLEKMQIAKRHLIKNSFEKNGVKPEELNITDDVIKDIIHNYTKEAGVRELDRQIDKLCRKHVRFDSIKEEALPVKITKKNLHNYLGTPKFDFGKVRKINKVGIIRGLAWTSVGGELLTIEAIAYPGKGQVVYTGSLGDVMKESISAALSLVKSHAKKYGLKPSDFSKQDIHVHVPEGATPKDGPSAGVGMCCAILSAMTNTPINANMALTGEVTLTGDILAIGGLKEKLLAAMRGQISQVIIPEENSKDIADLPKEVVKSIKIHCVSNIEDVFKLILVSS